MRPLLVVALALAGCAIGPGVGSDGGAAVAVDALPVDGAPIADAQPRTDARATDAVPADAVPADAGGPCEPGAGRGCNFDPGCCVQVLGDGRCFGDALRSAICGADRAWGCGPGWTLVAECTSWWTPEPPVDPDAG